MNTSSFRPSLHVSTVQLLSRTLHSSSTRTPPRHLLTAWLFYLPPPCDRLPQNLLSSMHPIHERIVNINTEQSQRYVADDSARRRYWAKHPTYFACIKCMDGRVHLPLITKTPTDLLNRFARSVENLRFGTTFLGRMRMGTRRLKHGKRNCVLVTITLATVRNILVVQDEYHTEHARNHAVKLARPSLPGEQMTTLSQASRPIAMKPFCTD